MFNPDTNHCIPSQFRARRPRFAALTSGLSRRTSQSSVSIPYGNERKWKSEVSHCFW
ncbi:hypothetical protein VFPPC_06005 [Pochonia chlamydosporia 170]|uniref:Uncharacterized protein n=1 Tax=Pochonia chlamydosporia 170 TaxID=1380566 RepID=A0A179FH95_METCM|nr:hypothetical protein VFPPC_06005 [Pochonia chlamydosporia 170]OAQ64777.1 hypothetical protein VFPPC_06005 [Pochonia chlamydosporia 170]